MANIEIGTSSEKDIVTLFGKPSSRTENNGYFTLEYRDPKEGYQRLFISFLSIDKKVISVIWLPFGGEAESSLAGAKSLFKKANFKEIVTIGKNPHFFSRTTSYMDESLGITILCHSDSTSVEVIARYDVARKGLLPANEEPEVKYTIGDELVSK